METLEAIDVGLLYWFAPRHTPQATAFWRAVTHLGDGPVLVVVLLLVMSGLLWVGRWRSAVILALAAGLGYGLSQTAKQVVRRPRPDVSWELMPRAASPSFPSGHAEGAMTIYLGSALLITWRWQRAWFRRAIVLGGLLLALLVGVSRLYLGLHFLTDVLGGWSAGLACALLALWLDRRVVPSAPSALPPRTTDPARGPFIV
jgi:undecaprenyl-diphosphatase